MVVCQRHSLNREAVAGIWKLLHVISIPPWGNGQILLYVNKGNQFSAVYTNVLQNVLTICGTNQTFHSMGKVK
jgi:hypothetical protein